MAREETAGVDRTRVGWGGVGGFGIYLQFETTGFTDRWNEDVSDTEVKDKTKR